MTAAKAAKAAEGLDSAAVNEALAPLLAEVNAWIGVEAERMAPFRATVTPERIEQGVIDIFSHHGQATLERLQRVVIESFTKREK